MNPASIACPFCGVNGRRILLPDRQEWVIQRSCPCRKDQPVEFIRFPALDRKEEIVEAETIQLDDDASCFHHPDRKAVAVCVECGIFICELCEVKVDGKSYCLSCFAKMQNAGPSKGKTENLRDGVMMWDRVALATAILPIFTFYFVILTAPYTIYLVLRHWKSHPTSVLGGSRWRFVLAFLIALGEIGAIGFMILAIITEFAML